MKLIQRLNKKIGGFWDGGLKDTFEWTVDFKHKGPKEGTVAVGSWEANHWFCMSGRGGERAILNRAKSILARKLAKRGILSEFELVEEDGD